MPKWTRRDRLIGLLSAALTTTGTAGSAHAQTRSATADVVPERPATAAVLPEQSTELPSSDPTARFDELNPKGWATPFPSASDTIVGDSGRIRTTLADQGIAVTMVASSSFQYDLLQNDRGYRGPQLYNGHQRVTRNASFASLYASSDLGRFGLSDGQLNLVASFTSNTLSSVNGPHIARVENVSYFQKLMDGRIEIKVGIFENSYEFIGTNVGGSVAAGTLGPNAIVPFQVGLSYLGMGTPALNVRAKLGERFYNKFGMQRSLPPGGAAAENVTNPSGLDLFSPGTRMLYVDELGFKQSSAPGTRSGWIRIGSIANPTRYPRLDGRGTKGNWSAYAAIDLQLTQPDPTLPFRGVYGGLSAQRAPGSVNVFDRYLEARLYGLGLIRSRPYDLASLVTSTSRYGRTGLRAFRQEDRQGYRETTSIVGSYAYRLDPGLYLQPGMGVTFHPVSSPRFGTALNTYLTITAIF